MTAPTQLQIAVLDRGFVYIGRCQQADGFLTITQAHCIRRWGTTGGLGELATTGPQPQTRLDVAGSVRAPMTALIHLIDVTDMAAAAFIQRSAAFLPQEA